MLDLTVTSPNQEKKCTALVIENSVPDPDIQHEYPVGGKLVITCREKYILLGEKEVTCQTDGEWSSRPECRKASKRNYLYIWDILPPGNALVGSMHC